jgi:excisionase family DNA binding protein
MKIEFPQVMTIEEMCSYLRIPKSSLYKLAQEGKIPCQKVGRHWRFRKASIDIWLDDRNSTIGEDPQDIDEDNDGN